ncbi:polyadenylate-binding protein 2 [Angomonas deanei]|nr:polyadenylate-binding protein 2 [Angomonas deanei]|eukprot:EPY37373.1 polyadenylate-binding protein 2 [Angomonas deanei]
MQRQVDSLQEDLKLKELQNAAAKDEGVRKTATATGKTNTSVFVSGMDPRTTDAELKVFFSACGPITRVTVLKDRFTQVSKGNAYVEFETAEQAKAAILKDGQSLHGKPLKVVMKRDNVPAFQRARGGAPGGYFPARGRGNPMQAAAMAMMATLMGGEGYNPYGRGRGRGRGRGY